MNILDTQIKTVRNVLRYSSGKGSINDLSEILNSKRSKKESWVLCFIDGFFSENGDVLNKVNLSEYGYFC